MHGGVKAVIAAHKDQPYPYAQKNAAAHRLNTLDDTDRRLSSSELQSIAAVSSLRYLVCPLTRRSVCRALHIHRCPRPARLPIGRRAGFMLQ